MSHRAEWLTLAGLGAYHGVNPAMGWLFAVSRGMTERSRRAVWGSLLPIAIGHEMSIALVALLVIGLSIAIDPAVLHIVAAVALIGFGIFRFVKPRAHFRWARDARPARGRASTGRSPARQTDRDRQAPRGARACPSTPR